MNPTKMGNSCVDASSPQRHDNPESSVQPNKYDSISVQQQPNKEPLSTVQRPNDELNPAAKVFEETIQERRIIIKLSEPTIIVPESARKSSNSRYEEDRAKIKGKEAISKQSSTPSQNVSYNVKILAFYSPRRETFCGLVNLGNTCYANSCLQILYNLKQVRRLFLENKNRGFFHDLIGNLFENMMLYGNKSANKIGSFEPKEFLKEFRKRRREFIRDEQHDAQEFMTVLLELLHQEINKVETDKSQMTEPKNQTEAWNTYLKYVDNSPLSKNFLGQTESVVTCQVCRNESFSWFCFWQVTLHLSSTTVTLNDCFKEFKDIEKLEEDCAPMCKKCQKKQPATKGQYICRSPHYLFCHLKRFTFDGRKIDSKVQIPDEMFVGTKHYKLQGAVLHTGFMQSGHYTTIISIPEGYFLHDDDEVLHLSDKNELLLRNKLDYDTYMVFYKSVKFVSKAPS